MNNGTGRVWAVNANGGDEGRPNGVGPVYIENIDKIGGGVPDPSGASTGDVLTVDSQGNPAWEPPTGGGSYTAGDGIDITENEVSVNVGTGLSINSGGTVDMTLKAIKWNDKYYSIGLLTAQAVAAIKGNASLAVTVLSDYTFSPAAYYSFYDARIAIVPGQDAGRLPNVSAAKAILSTTNIYSSFVRNSGASVYTMPANTQVTVDFSNPTVGSSISWADVEANPTNYLLAIVGDYYGVVYDDGNSYSEAAGSDPEQKDVSTIEYTVAGDNSLQVSNPLPASTVADADKILTVNAQGAAAWGSNPLPSSTVADADKILTVNAQGAAAWGMRIQQVAALPANPDANTLYLIPEA